MRRDGDITYFFVQHRFADDVPWGESALEHFLFSKLTRDEHLGNIGKRYHELLKPQSASSDLWQKYGIHGFVNKDDGLRVLQELRALPGFDGYEFRLVVRAITQCTAAVA